MDTMQEAKQILMSDIRKLNIPTLLIKLKDPSFRPIEIQDLVEEVDGIFYSIVRTLTLTKWINSSNKSVAKEVDRMILILDTFLNTVVSCYNSRVVPDHELKENMMAGMEALKAEWFKTKELCNIQEKKSFSN